MLLYHVTELHKITQILWEIYCKNGHKGHLNLYNMDIRSALEYHQGRISITN